MNFKALKRVCKKSGKLVDLRASTLERCKALVLDPKEIGYSHAQSFISDLDIFIVQTLNHKRGDRDRSAYNYTLEWRMLLGENLPLHIT